MSTSSDTLSFFLECLEGIPDLRAKAMFWEYGIYSWDRMFALACDDTLFLKTYPATIHLFEDNDTKAYPGSKNTAQVNADWLENKEELARIVKLTLENTPPPKPKKKKISETH
jgi:DNA transformation protein